MNPNWNQSCPHQRHRASCPECRRDRAPERETVRPVAPHTDDDAGVAAIRRRQREFLRDAERDLMDGTDLLGERIARHIEGA